MQAARLKSLKADLMPRFGIQFLGGTGTLVLSGLPGYGGNNALAGVTASVPIFTGGRLRARVEAGDAELTAALANQDKAVLQALEEVEAAYGFRHGLDERIAGLEQARTLTARRMGEVQAFFRSGRATRGCLAGRTGRSGRAGHAGTGPHRPGQRHDPADAGAGRGMGRLSALTGQPDQKSVRACTRRPGCSSGMRWPV
jgi:hypothetical protein